MVTNAAEGPSGKLKISDMHEYAANDPEEGRKVLLETCKWPSGTKFSKTQAFGVDS
jgi:hypothetical protein